MFPSLLHVETFVPSEKLVLEQSVLDWRVLPRLLVTLFFLPFLIAPLVPVLVPFFMSGSSGEAVSTGIGTLIGLILFFLFFLVFWYGILGLMIYAAGLVFGCWNRVVLDRSDDRISMTYEGHWIWGRNTTTIDRDRVREMRVEVSGRGNDEVTMQFELRCGSGREDTGTEEQSMRFRVRHVDLVEEAMALASAMGDILDMKSILVDRSDHLETSFRISREEPADDPDRENGARPLPSIQSDFKFRQDAHSRSAGGMEQVTQFGRPEIDLVPFDPDVHTESPGYLQPKFEWNPGERVVIDVPPMPTWLRVLASLLFGLIFGVVFGTGFGGFLQHFLKYVHLHLPIWGIGVLIGGTVSVFAWFGLGKKYRRRRTDLDWNANAYDIRIGRRTLHGSLDQIHAFVVKGYRHKGGDDSPTKYDCCVIIDLEDGRETIYWTDKDTDREAVYRQAGSLAEDLADALEIDWKWKGFE